MALNAVGIVMVRVTNGYRHLYAVRKDGAVAYADLLGALAKRLGTDGRITYWEMKKRRLLLRQAGMERVKGIEPSS